MKSIRHLLVLLLTMCGVTAATAKDKVWLTKTITLTSTENKTAMILLDSTGKFSVTDPKGLIPADNGTYYDSIFQGIDVIVLEWVDGGKKKQLGTINGTKSVKMQEKDKGDASLGDSKNIEVFTWECTKITYE